MAPDVESKFRLVLVQSIMRGVHNRSYGRSVDLPSSWLLGFARHLGPRRTRIGLMQLRRIYNAADKVSSVFTVVQLDITSRSVQ